MVLILISITGCTYQTTDQTDILKAETVCKNHLGIKHIKVYFGGTERAYCIDGTSFALDLIKLPISNK